MFDRVVEQLKHIWQGGQGTYNNHVWQGGISTLNVFGKKVKVLIQLYFVNKGVKL